MDADTGTVTPPGAMALVGLLVTIAGSMLLLIFSFIEPPPVLLVLAGLLVGVGVLLVAWETWRGSRREGVGLWRSFGRSLKAALSWAWSSLV